MANAASPLRLAEIAAKLGCEVVAGGETFISGVGALADAGPQDLSFVRSNRYADALALSRAGAVIAPSSVDTGDRPTLRSENPSRDFARAVSLLVAINLKVAKALGIAIATEILYQADRLI